MVFRNPGDRETNDAIQEGIEAGNLAQGRADREAEGWEAGGIVEEAIRDWLATKREFTADDIQNEVILPMVEREEVASRDTRVLGPYITRMKNDGLISDTGYTEPSKRRRASPQRVWRTNRRATMRKWRLWSGGNERDKVQRGIDSTEKSIQNNEDRILELQDKIAKAREENEQAQQDIDYVRERGGYDRERDLSELANLSRDIQLAVIFETSSQASMGPQGETFSQEMLEEERIEDIVELQQKEGVQIGPEMTANVFRKRKNSPGWDKIYEHDFVMEDEKGLLGNLAWTEERYFRNGSSAPSKWRSLELDNSSDGAGLRTIAQAIADTDFYMVAQNPFNGNYSKVGQDMDFAPLDPLVIEYNEQYGYIRPTFGMNEDQPMGEDYQILMESPEVMQQDEGARFVERINSISPGFQLWLGNFIQELGGLAQESFWATVGRAEREQIVELARRYELANDKTTDEIYNSEQLAIRTYIKNKYQQAIQDVIEDVESDTQETQLLSDSDVMQSIADAIDTLSEEELDEIGIDPEGWGKQIPVMINQGIASVDVFEYIQSDWASKWAQQNNSADFLTLLADVRANIIGRTTGFVLMDRNINRPSKTTTKPTSFIGIPEPTSFERGEGKGWREFERRIGGIRFHGSPRVFNSKINARLLAQKVRTRGLNARVIPAKGGYRIYFGRRKSV